MTQKETSLTNEISGTGSVNIIGKMSGFHYSTVLCFQLNVEMNGEGKHSNDDDF